MKCAAFMITLEMAATHKIPHTTILCQPFTAHTDLTKALKQEKNFIRWAQEPKVQAKVPYMITLTLSLPSAWVLQVRLATLLDKICRLRLKPDFLRGTFPLEIRSLMHRLLSAAEDFLIFTLITNQMTKSLATAWIKILRYSLNL